ncbi:hypothetical protein ACWNYI_00500 [Candidatus Vidania fulgoroideorum]
MKKINEEIISFFKKNYEMLKNNIGKIKNCFFDTNYFGNIFIKDKRKKIYLKNFSNIYNENNNIVIDFDKNVYCKKFYSRICSIKYFNLLLHKRKIIVSLKKNINKKEILKLLDIEKEKFNINSRIYVKNFKNKINNMFKRKEICLKEKKQLIDYLNNQLILFKKKSFTF